MERRRQALIRESRRHQFVRAALVGIIAGFMGVLFQLALVGAENLRHRSVEAMRSHAVLGVLTMMAACSLLAGASTWLTARFAPEASGSGIPHVKEVLLGLRQMRWIRMILVKFIGGFLGLAAGLSLGREGPTIQIGAATGRGVAEKLGVPKRSYKTLISCGAGAGLSAAFNAPLAGFLFVIEELQRELTPITYGAALIASVAADAMTRVLLGQHSAFHITGYPTPPMSALPLLALLGIIVGFLGVGFNRSLTGALDLAERRKLHPAVKGMLVGAAAGLAVWFAPSLPAVGTGRPRSCWRAAWAGPPPCGSCLRCSWASLR